MKKGLLASTMILSALITPLVVANNSLIADAETTSDLKNIKQYAKSGKVASVSKIKVGDAFNKVKTQYGNAVKRDKDMDIRDSVFYKINKSSLCFSDNKLTTISYKLHKKTTYSAISKVYGKAKLEESYLPSYSFISYNVGKYRISRLLIN